MHTVRSTWAQPTPQNKSAILLSTAQGGAGDKVSTQLEVQLADARLRLLRALHTWGISPDLAEDIVQDTLLAAWRHRGQLRSLDHVDVWLTSIARNCCRMHFRRTRPERVAVLRPTVSTSVDVPFPDALDEPSDDSLTAISDPGVLDPLDELERRDVVSLLDRALGLLSAESRQVTELCYLAEIPQRIVAAQLGISLSALEARLYRARKQLRQLLSSDLLSEAETLGLSVIPSPSASWRATREWCHWCGRERLQGYLEPQTDGTSHLRLRCPGCLQRSGAGWADSGPVRYLARYRSFGPAIRQFHATSSAYYRKAITNNATCQACGDAIQVSALLARDGVANAIYPTLIYTMLACPRCGTSSASLAAVTSLADSQIAAFLHAHPRWVIEPDMPATFQSRQAFRHRISDQQSAAHVTFFTDATTLSLLATVVE